jgi:integrase/recombinase XerC
MAVERASDGMALVPYVSPDPLTRAAAWAAMAPAARRRRAITACQERDRATLAELVTGYLLTKSRARARVSPHTLESYTLAVRSLLDHWSEENLLHPSPDAADRYVAALSRDARPATVAARLAGAKALYRALRWCTATEADPFGDVRAPRDPTPRHERRHPYADADVAALIAVAERADRALILLCAHGGLRIAEALGLCWQDVDLQRSTVRVTAGKGRKARTVRLSASLLAALQAIRPAHDQGPVIAASGGVAYADPTVPRRRLRQLCARAGVTYMSFHSLRHTAGTRLARESGNLQLVAAHLGHADVSTAAIYAKWSDETLRKAVQDW